jgi:hypothetical protein
VSKWSDRRRIHVSLGRRSARRNARANRLVRPAPAGDSSPFRHICEPLPEWPPRRLSCESNNGTAASTIFVID